MKRSAAVPPSRSCLPHAVETLPFDLFDRSRSGAVRTTSPQAKTVENAISSCGLRRPDLPSPMRGEAGVGGRGHGERARSESRRRSHPPPRPKRNGPSEPRASTGRGIFRPRRFQGDPPRPGRIRGSIRGRSGPDPHAAGGFAGRGAGGVGGSAGGGVGGSAGGEGAPGGATSVGGVVGDGVAGVTVVGGRVGPMIGPPMIGPPMIGPPIIWPEPSTGA